MAQLIETTDLNNRLLWAMGHFKGKAPKPRKVWRPWDGERKKRALPAAPRLPKGVTPGVHQALKRGELRVVPKAKE